MDENCIHGNFEASVDVNRIQNSEHAHHENRARNYQADVRIRCVECGQPFEFIGLPAGLNYRGATVSADGQEARLSIKPANTPDPRIDGPSGFSIRVEEKKP